MPYLRSKVCQELGLRKAPEIRFYHDNTPDIERELETENNYEDLTGYKYDDHSYDTYIKEFKMFVNWSKLKVEQYIENYVPDEDDVSYMHLLPLIIQMFDTNY